jgi:hypothetical protein
VTAYGDDVAAARARIAPLVAVMRPAGSQPGRGKRTQRSSPYQWMRRIASAPRAETGSGVRQMTSRASIFQLDLALQVFFPVDLAPRVPNPQDILGFPHGR